MNTFEKPMFDVYVNVDYAYSEIMEGLFIGSQISALSKLIFQKHKIQRVLAVGKGLEKGFVGKCAYMSISIEDSRNEDIYQFLDKSYNFIDNALSDKAPLMVHCAEGISRSATLVMAYFIRKYRWSFVDAMHFVSERRDIINPNRYFEKQLIEYHLRRNTNILTDRRFKKRSRKHSRHTKILLETDTKQIIILSKNGKTTKKINITPKKLNLKESARVDIILKFCRFLGNKLLYMYDIPIESRREKLLKITEKRSNYINEIVDPNLKRSKDYKRKLADKVQRFVKDCRSEVIDSFFNSNYEEDRERLRPSQQINSK